MPQAWYVPALTWVKVPSGGEVIAPQHATVPSGRMPQAW
jgi:hypothetical protein